MSISQIVPQKQEILQQLNERVAALVKHGESIDVKDQASDVLAKQFKVEVKSYEKAVDLYADADIQDVKERLSTLQTAKKMLLAPVLAVFETVERRRKAAEERRERERIIEEERKRREKEIDAQRKAGELKAAEAKKLQRQAEEEATRAKAIAAEEEKKQAANIPVVKVKANITA